ncbi:hypothetical protein GCM10010095_19720 [Streptomyces anthocyanicus]|nr:hypothetical protein GCM10010095_19720 [Streptomyces anthocyanicus]
MVGDRVDLRRGLGRGEGVQVRGEVGGGPGLVRQGVRGAEGLCVASCPPLQVRAGGEVVTGGVDLVGVAADVVVQVEVWVERGDAEVLRAGAGLTGRRCSGRPSRGTLVEEDGYFEERQALNSWAGAEGVGAVGIK